MSGVAKKSDRRFNTPMTGDPVLSDDQVSERLIEFLGREYRDEHLTYAEPCTRLTGGFETLVYGLKLQTSDPQLEGQLVLRLLRYYDPVRIEHEATVQNTIADMGYPAPRVLFICPGPEPLGASFLLMRRMPGYTLAQGLEGLGNDLGPLMRLKMMARLPGYLAGLPRILAAEQRRLHELDAERLRSEL